MTCGGVLAFSCLILLVLAATHCHYIFENWESLLDSTVQGEALQRALPFHVDLCMPGILYCQLLKQCK
jgi:hypothetical protein